MWALVVLLSIVWRGPDAPIRYTAPAHGPIHPTSRMAARI